MKPLNMLSLVLLATATLAACDRNAPTPTPSAPPAKREPRILQPVAGTKVPSANDFKTAKAWDEASVDTLLAFREDLLDRRAYDLSQNKNQPSSQTTYFDGLLQKIDSELTSRGLIITPDNRVAEP